LDYYNAIADDFVLDSTSPHTVFSKAARNRAINQAREDIAYQSECIRLRVQATATTDQMVYDFSGHNATNVLFKLNHVVYGTVALKHKILEDDLIYSRHLSDSGIPEYWMQDADLTYLYLIPAPTTSSVITMYGKAYPGALSTSTSELEVEIPNKFRHLVPEYALWKGFKKDGITDGLARAQYHENEYQSGLARAIARQKQDTVTGGRIKFGIAGYTELRNAGL